MKVKWQQYVAPDGCIFHWHPDDEAPDNAQFLTQAQYEEICANITEQDRELKRVEGSFGVPWQERFRKP